VIQQDDPAVGGSLMPGGCLRCCKYAAAASSEESGQVAFAPHTDTTLLTLAMCSTVSGLEIKSREGVWQAPEAGRGPMQLLIMPGEFLEVLTKGYLRSSLHRVLRPPPGEARLSMPFLVRGKPRAVVNSRLHMDRARERDPTGLNPVLAPVFTLFQRTLVSPLCSPCLTGCGNRVLEEEGKTMQWLWDRHGGWVRHYTST
jgi:isopenicillin N synthase-like dioxygenase